MAHAADDDFFAETQSEVIDARPGSRFMRPVEIVSAGLLILIVGLLLGGVFSRYVLSTPIFWIDEVVSIAFLWLAMLGSSIAIDRNEHLRLTVVLLALPPRARSFVETLALVLVGVVLASLLWPAIEHVQQEALVRSVSLGISLGYRASALPAGISLMGLTLAVSLWRSASSKDFGLSVLIVAVVGGLFWLVSDRLEDLGDLNILIFLVGFVGIFLLLGVPIAFCFGLGTLSFLLYSTYIPTVVMIGRMDEGMSSLILVSVPIFVLLGCVLDATGMGKAIVDFMASFLGHVKAGMSYVLLGSMFLVSGISGSKVSDMATVAPALFPEMKRRGHKPKEMIALLATGAAMADTVPPSIVLIVLGSIAGVSIASLFTSGFVIAMVLLIVLAILARWKARDEDMTGVQRPSLKLILRYSLVAAPVLLLPFLIRGAVGGGIATATEVSTIAVLYAMIIGIVLYGGIRPTKIYAMLVETAALSGAILVILGTASAMAWALTQTGFAGHIANQLTELPGGAFIYLLATILVFMILGCVLEGLPAIVLMAPLMFPIARQLGINDVHYSMVVVTAMNIGLMTPPIGIGFYIACKIGNVPPDEAMGAIWPYLLALLIGLLAIAAVPALTTAYL
ncbi:ABC transporter permease [Rhizobium wenxiniae]|uniref:Tripartite ATP-independent transporter DctM subunit n=1 Tax=Rhizobium wenxiniae TaxID=1737357 RepID=A0A7X0D3A7_9HYPH|nr:tripartite ATP-independent transporter DctM subunit [Rhizobium wenxiniae]GGG14415.1 ABC transporter permease [Rhizobium wenxiniae]